MLLDNWLGVVFIFVLLIPHFKGLEGFLDKEISDKEKFDKFKIKVVPLLESLFCFCFFVIYANYIYDDIYNTPPSSFIDFFKFITGEHFIGGPFNVLCLFFLVIITFILRSIFIRISYVSKFDTPSDSYFWFLYTLNLLILLIHQVIFIFDVFSALFN